MKTYKFLLNSIGLSVLALSVNAPGGTETATNNISSSLYIPHVYLSGYGGTDIQGGIDVLAPVYLKADRNAFIYGQGEIEDQSNSSGSADMLWKGSLGAGYRQILGQRIYGAYLLADYGNTPDNNYSLMLSPGFETLGEIVDFRVNGYFPVGSDSWVKSGTEYVGHDTTNNYDLYDNYTNYENVSPGGDAEVGVKLFSIKHMPVKAYLNTYYFAPAGDDDSVLGIGGRLTFQPTRYLILEAKDSYDNKNDNVVMLGAKVYLNGFNYGFSNTHVDDAGLQSRLFDPIERNLAAAGMGAETASSIHKESNGVAPSDYNTVYVVSGGTDTDGVLTGDGSYSNPYVYQDESDMQAILDATENVYGNDSVRIYFTSPAGSPFYMPSTIDGSYVTPYSNQELWGTTGDDWTLPTTPDSYAVDFMGAFSLDGVSNVGFHYLELDNYETGAFNEAMQLNNAQDIVLQSVKIGNDPNSSSTGNYNTGIEMTNGSSLTLNNAKVYGDGVPDSSYTGTVGGAITVQNGGDIVTNNNTLVKGKYVGINLLPNTDGNIIMSSFNGDGTGQFFGDIYGLYADAGSGTITVDSIANTNFSSGDGSEEEYGAYFNSTAGEINIGGITNASFTGGTPAATGFSTGLAIGAFGDDTGLTLGSVTIGDIVGSTFTGGSGGEASFGFMVYNGASNSSVQIGDISGSTFTSGISGTSSFGFSVGGYSQLNIDSITKSHFIGGNTVFMSAGMYAYNGNGSVTIGDIRSSEFTAGSATYVLGSSYGLYLTNTAGTSPSSITIGDVYDSSFTGEDYGMDLIVYSGGGITIDSIAASTFTGAYGIKLGSSANNNAVVTVAGKGYTSASSLLSDLNNNDNTFKTTTNAILLNSSKA